MPVLLHQVTLRDFNTSFKQYRHLIDGGVSDNVGIETLVETFRAQVDGAKNQAEGKVQNAWGKVKDAVKTPSTNDSESQVPEADRKRDRAVNE